MNILTRDQQAAGLILRECEDSVSIMDGDKFVAAFGIHATIAGIRAAAQTYMETRKAAEFARARVQI